MYLCMFVCIYIYVGMYIYVCIYMYVCMYVCIQTCIPNAPKSDYKHPHKLMSIPSALACEKNIKKRPPHNLA